MFLKRIDVMGFKSFADKTAVEFSPGITAVVGPNGSGKSNIADAIRWVLGEQSARNLRGSKMEDVIFAGSENRKSINFCEVSLTLDNSDRHLPVVFDEVTITRRVYRSGESEYMLNKQPCRLKDITELFMDSGLGRESYSIIGQGKIEEMLSTRPEDRRGPFEDAAGIVKYKFRRKEAERKLEETSANMTRVDDILAELERQAGPLEMEAGRAEQYKQLQGELTELDVSLLVFEIDELQKRWKQSAAAVEALSEQRQHSASELAECEAQLQRARAEFEAKNAAAEVRQSQLVDTVEERERTEGTLALLQERIRNAEQSLADRRSQRDQVAAELLELSEQQQELAARLATVQAALELKSSELEAAAHAVDPSVRASLEGQIDRLNAELIDAHHRAATHRNEIKSAEEALSNEGRRQERLDAELEKWRAEAENWQKAAAARKEQQDKLRDKQAELEQQIGSTSEQQRSLAEREAACVSELHRIQSGAASLRSRLELLKELEEGYDGYALGVKTVLQAAGQKRIEGVYGSVASLINVPKHLEVAMETALGGALQNIVVASEADARTAIEMLKRRQAGRATFMPLDVIKSRFLSANEVNKARQVNGFVGVASELVMCEETYRKVVEHLLGNVVIAEELLNANQLARALDYRVRIVTLEGDIVSPGGVMSGGSHARKGPGLLGRTRERADVQRLIDESTFKEQQLREQQRHLRSEITGVQQAQQALLTRLESTRMELASSEASLREVAAKEQNCQERLQGVLWEQQQLQSGQSLWQVRANEANDKLTMVEGTLEEIEAKLAQSRRDLEIRDQSVAEAQERVTTLRVEVATLNQEKSATSQRGQDLSARVLRLRQRDAQLMTDVDSIERSITESTEAMTHAEQRLAVVLQSVADCEAELVQLRQLRQSAEADVAGADRRVRDQQDAVRKMDEQLHRAEVTAERTDMELHHVLRKIGETYHMTYEWAKQNFPAVTDVETVRKAADRLRRQIAELGEVQIGAIEEWNRLSERMGFLQRERQDLSDAQAQLRDVIQEIDEEMSRRFATAFEQIRAEFEVAFRVLFNGGRADLQLTDPNDLLHTGIDVIAQPPGKKLQNLNLMSGGERALTAMALLFAILRVRPVPFCVLDEVEAALDEANVSRFAQQVRRFAAETQFIVITHRRGTMEEADVLYGVTMQGSGVSSLVSVRLSDDAEIETA